jgi:hypothetical protein
VTRSLRPLALAFKLNNQPTEWASGTHNQIEKYLKTFPWEDAMLLCHNTMFDGSILSWRFDIRPRVYTDTLCIAVPFMGLKLAQASLRYLKDTISALKALRYSTPSENGVEILHQKN